MYSGMADVAAVTGDEAMRAAGKRIWDYLDHQQALSHRRHRRVGQRRSVRPAVRAAEHDRLQRDLRVGRHGLLEPSPVPARRRREVHRRDGAHALQRAASPACRSTARRSSIPTRSSRTASTRGRNGSASPAAPATSRASCRRCPAIVYATRGDALYVNLFAQGTADVELPGGAVKIDAGDALSVGRRREDDGRRRRRRDGSPINVRIPGWARNEPVPSDLYAFLDNGAPAATLTVNGAAGADDARQGLRDDRSHVGAGRHDRARPADAGPPRRLERSGDGQSRSRRAAARPDRLRRRVARQPERQGPQHRAARRQRADDRVPRAIC